MTRFRDMRDIKRDDINKAAQEMKLPESKIYKWIWE